MDTKIKEETVSDCCSSRVWSPTEEWSMCSECNDYCETVKTE